MNKQCNRPKTGFVVSKSLSDENVVEKILVLRVRKPTLEVL